MARGPAAANNRIDSAVAVVLLVQRGYIDCNLGPRQYYVAQLKEAVRRIEKICTHGENGSRSFVREIESRPHSLAPVFIWL